MALVSISEAARLTGKSRTTVQSYIKQGKLTKCTDSSGSSKARYIRASACFRIIYWSATWQ
ncbi:helix-turn-helix domain-containing protein [Escherichia coli]